jgi:hypothetical protein
MIQKKPARGKPKVITTGISSDESWSRRHHKSQSVVCQEYETLASACEVRFLGGDKADGGNGEDGAGIAGSGDSR